MDIPSEDCDDRTRLSYHEAGHAVAAWLFGEAHDILQINMKGNRKLRAYVRGKGLFHRPENLRAMMASEPECVNSLARIAVFCNLAGLAVEGIIDGDESWLSAEVDTGYYTEPDCEHNDITSAVTVCGVVHGADSPKSWKMLETVAKWTEEAFRDERAWSVLQSLAERLRTQSTMTGWVAMKLMGGAGAWAADAHYPILQLSPKWQRRVPALTKAFRKRMAKSWQAD